MQVRLLGPLRIVDSDGSEMTLGAAKERALLVALSLSPGHVVTTEALTTALWGDEPPATARKTLQTYVKNVRAAIGADCIVTDPHGYELRIEPDDVDAVAFRELVRTGEQALRSDDIPTARNAFTEATALWRGQPLTDVAPHTRLANEATRLREEYLSALDARVTADLAAGDHDHLVPELETLTTDYPFRERFWAHLMLALYRSGRQADALAAYQRARSVLLDELGLEPGGELKRIEHAVLVHDPALDLATNDDDEPAQLTVVRSPVRYAVSSNGVRVAYQIAGEGPVDIIVVPGFVSHLDMWWDAPTDYLMRRLVSIGRVILLDKRGMGLSDRPNQITPEEWVDDVAAVLDAAGSRQAVVIGVSAGVTTALRFVAKYNDRTAALVLWGGDASFSSVEPDDGRVPLAIGDAMADSLADNWGAGSGLEIYAPSLVDDPVAREFLVRCEMICASPSAACEFLRALLRLDSRDALPLIDAPTLVLHAEKDAMVPVSGAHYMAEHIPDAELVVLDSDIHLIWLSDVITEATGAIQDFVRRRVVLP